MESPAAEKRQMSIAQWRALAGEGTVIPMRIPLEGDSMRPLIRRGRDPVTIVPLSRALKRGDVVCFDTEPTDGDLSDHTGIYLGQGYFIHSSSGAGKVIVSSLTSGYYKDNFSWGRRILN